MRGHADEHRHRHWHRAAAMSQAADVVLDPAIRQWVLLPITLTMILVGCLRNNVMQLLNSPPKTQPLKAVREQ
jgi:uncharacterized protein involved in cysteine biosynthesis